MEWLKSEEDILTKTDEVIDNFIRVMELNDLEHCWEAWHPHRLATAAAYMHLFVAAPCHRMSRWHAQIVPRRLYIPADRIESLPTLASHCLPLQVRDRNAASPRVADTPDSPSSMADDSAVPPCAADAGKHSTALECTQCSSPSKAVRNLTNQSMDASNRERKQQQTTTTKRLRSSAA